MLTSETIKISGMSCNHCVSSVEEALKQLQVEKYNVKIGSVKVEYNSEKLTKAEIMNAIEESGYEVIKNSLT